MRVHILATRRFARDARKAGLAREPLREAVAEMRRGLIDADLGGGLVKTRIARAGKGKSGGFRGLVATHRGSRWIYLYLFAKSARDNIGPREEEALKKLAAELLADVRLDRTSARCGRA